MPKHLLRLLALPTVGRRKSRAPGSHTAKHSRPSYATCSLLHIAPEYLEYIVSQVQAEGYHVEYIARFGGQDSMESIDAITRWAKRAGLKVTINHERGICFFETLS